jgi:glycosyltransferase involved in cell wall biosynthesis
MIRSPIPMVVTLHDLAGLKRRGEYLRSGMLFKLRYLAVQRAVRVIVPTAAVADDAITALQIPIERIAVIAEAPAPAFYPRPAPEVAAAREQFGLPEEYLLWVGGLQTPDPRKRIAGLARAERTMPLVLAGPIAPWARELPNVILTSEVSDDQLAAIYTGAHALVLPSDEEGFGLPPIEALACGTPVAACDVRAVREVLEGRAALTAVDNLDELMQAAESLTRPAPAPPPWSWRDAAAATWDVYMDAAVAPARWRGPKRRRSVPATVD